MLTTYKSIVLTGNYNNDIVNMEVIVWRYIL